jgi:hypothetical protein
MNSFWSALGLIFITLKLTHYIDWSWWYVTAPFWGGAILVYGFILASVVIIALWGSPLQRARLRAEGWKI